MNTLNNIKFQSGTITKAFSGVGGRFTITFPETFASKPMVFLSAKYLGGERKFTVALEDAFVTSKSAKGIVSANGQMGYETEINIDWLALQIE